MTEPDHIPQRIIDLAVAALKQEKHIACVGCAVLPPEKIARIMIAAVRTQVLDDRDAALPAAGRDSEQSSDEIRRDMLRAISRYSGPVIADLAASHSEHWTEAAFVAEWDTIIGGLIAAVRREDLAAFTAERDEARQLVRELAQPRRCDIDRKGNCETHGWSQYRSGVQHCPHGRAQRAGLTRPAKETTDA